MSALCSMGLCVLLVVACCAVSPIYEPVRQFVLSAFLSQLYPLYRLACQALSILFTSSFQKAHSISSIFLYFPLPSLFQAGVDMRAHSTIKAFVQQLTVPLSSPSPPPPLLPSTPMPEEPVPNSSSSSGRSSSSSSSRSIHSCRCSHEEEDEDEDEFEDVDLEAGYLEAGDACSTTNATIGENDDEQEDENGRAICLICYEEFPMEEKLPRTKPHSSSSGSSSSSTTTPNGTSTSTGRPPSPPPRSASASSCPSSAQYCPHSYCGRCVKAYIETRIHEGRAEHPCPMRGDAGCNFVFG